MILLFNKAAKALLGGLFAVLSSMGCSSLPMQSDRLLMDADKQQPLRHELEAVAFYPQQQYQCGPAALATVLDWSGVPVTPEALVPQLYIPERRGSLQADLLAAARAHGRIAYRLRPTLSVLLQELRAGHPVLVMQNLGLEWLPQWHYAVLVGYDLENNHLVLRSGTHRRHLLRLQTFEHTWRRAGHWALVVLAPQQLPASAEEGPYLQTVVNLERQGQLQAAHSAYRQALERWPGSAAAWMGLGNTAYAQGDWEVAAAAFRRVLALRADYAPALNNLAQTLAESGQPHAARDLAQKAASLGGQQAATYRQTLQGIEAALAGE